MISYKRSIVIPVAVSIGLVLIGIGLMTKPEPAVISGLCYLLLNIPSALYAYFLRKQGAVFVLNEQYLEYQSRRRLSAPFVRRDCGDSIYGFSCLSWLSVETFANRRK